MATDIPKYLTAEQERVINDFQRVAQELMVDGVTAISMQILGKSYSSFMHSSGQCFMSNENNDLASSLNSAIHEMLTTIKSPAEQAQIDYDRAMKAMENAKAKLDALS